MFAPAVAFRATALADSTFVELVSAVVAPFAQRIEEVGHYAFDDAVVIHVAYGTVVVGGSGYVVVIISGTVVVGIGGTVVTMGGTVVGGTVVGGTGG